MDEHDGLIADRGWRDGAGVYECIKVGGGRLRFQDSSGDGKRFVSSNNEYLLFSIQKGNNRYL